MSLRRLGVSKKVEREADYLEPEFGLLDQLGPPSHNSHLYPTPPKVSRVVDIEERLEPPSPPFAQGRISSRIRAMFTGDHAPPKVPAALRWATHRGPIPTTSDSVVPYLEPHEAAKKEHPNDKHLALITPPASQNHGRRYPWEPKKRSPLPAIPEVEDPTQPPPIKFPQFRLNPWELEDHVSNGLDLYDPVSPHFDDFDESYFHPRNNVGTSGPQDGSSPNRSHKRSGLVHTITARKQYPKVVRISHSLSDGQIVKQGILSGSMASPTRISPVPQTAPPLNKVTDTWLNDGDGEESETEGSTDTSHPSMSQEEVGGSLSHGSLLEVLTQPRRRKRHEVDPDIRLERGSMLLPPAIHLPEHERSLGKVGVASPLFGPEAVTAAALLLGTGKDVDQADSMEVMFNRPAVHYRNLATAGDKSFTWREGVRPVASRPLKDSGNIQEKSTNDSNELRYKVGESNLFDPPSKHPSDNNKLSTAYSQRGLGPPGARMETVEDTCIDPPSAVVTQPRCQIPLVGGHWIPNRGCPTTTISTAPSPHRKILKSLATLTTSKSAPQSSQFIPVGGDSIYTSNREPPEVPKDAGTRSFRIKGAGPWLVKHLPQKKPANPFLLDAPMPEVKKPLVPDPDENFEKFLRARAEVEEASHRPPRRRAKHLAGAWEGKRDC